MEKVKRKPRARFGGWVLGLSGTDISKLLGRPYKYTQSRLKRYGYLGDNNFTVEALRQMIWEEVTNDKIKELQNAGGPNAGASLDLLLQRRRTTKGRNFPLPRGNS